MDALVVVESMFGNTRQVAEAVAEGLSAGGARRVAVVDVAQAPTAVPEGVGLLVVGAPTHVFGMTRASTRRSAVDAGAHPASVDRGVREWLLELDVPAHAVPAAAFDTRVGLRVPSGSAARAVLRRLRRCGFRPAARATTFYVEGNGPLVDGELDRARAWGERLVRERGRRPATQAPSRAAARAAAPGRSGPPAAATSPPRRRR